MKVVSLARIEELRKAFPVPLSFAHVIRHNFKGAGIGEFQLFRATGGIRIRGFMVVCSAVKVQFMAAYHLSVFLQKQGTLISCGGFPLARGKKKIELYIL